VVNLNTETWEPILRKRPLNQYNWNLFPFGGQTEFLIHIEFYKKLLNWLYLAIYGHLWTFVAIFDYNYID